MRSNMKRGMIALLGLGPALVAFTAVESAMTLQPQSRLWVAGTSTVRSFECAARTIDAQVIAAGPGASAAVMTGEKAVKDVEVSVPAAKLDCKNGTMNEHMLKALKASDAPTIVFRLSGYELEKASAGMGVKVNGTLTLGGTEKPITVLATAVDAGNGALRVTGTHELNMKDFGLKPPTLMMGTMKVNEKVKVGFDFVLAD